MKRQSVIVLVILFIATFCLCNSAFAGYLYGTLSGTGYLYRINPADAYSELIGQGIDSLGGLAYVPVIPAPSAIILGTIGVGFVTWMRKRRTI